MYRQPPSEYAKAGQLGIDITLKLSHLDTEPKKVFLGCESMAEEMVQWGESIVNNFVYTIFEEEIKESWLIFKNIK